MQENHSPTLFQKMQNYQSEGKGKEIRIKCKKSYTKLHWGGGGLGPRTCMLSYYLYYPLKFFCSSVLFRRFREFSLSVSGMILESYLIFDAYK